VSVFAQLHQSNTFSGIIRSADKAVLALTTHHC